MSVKSNQIPYRKRDNNKIPYKVRENRTRYSNNNNKINRKDENVITISEYDPVIFFTVAVLVLFGLVMIFSSSYYSASRKGESMFVFFRKQAIAVFIGFLAMISAALMNYNKWLKKPAPWLYIIANILLVYVKFFGKEIYGAKRWIDVPIFGSFQPSELAKISVIILLASFISGDKNRVKELKGLIQCGIIIIIPVILVFWGNNLSTALIIIAIGGGMIFISSPYTVIYLVGAGVGVVSLIAYLALSSGFRGDRFAVWHNPFIDPLGKGFQTIQSLYAVASGGMFGLGLGQSKQKLMFMPEPHNDFIFAVICEELGFFGGGMVLLLFGILIWRCMKVAINAPDLFGTLIAAGAVILLGVQVIINVAVVTNTIPNTGIPLPFISYGGTSVLFMMGLMGIVLNISRYSKKNI